MNALINGTKLTAFLTVNLMLASTGGCAPEELFPIRQFTQDFILGWIAALLL
jgi:hypothetical protein